MTRSVPLMVARPFKAGIKIHIALLRRVSDATKKGSDSAHKKKTVGNLTVFFVDSLIYLRPTLFRYAFFV